MPSQTEIEQLVVKLANLLDDMINQQRIKVGRTASRIQPGLSDDDLRDPHSFPSVNTRPEFAYEDGILAGLIAAQTAVLRDGVEFMRDRQEEEAED